MADSPRKTRDSDNRIGIGSFAFRYAVGIPGFAPSNPMRTEDFIVQASSLGVKTIQLCENLHFADESMEALRSHSRLAKDLGLEVEIGMQGLNEENVRNHLRICELFESRLLRVVVGNVGADRAGLVDHAAKTLTGLLPALRDYGVTAGVENHFDLTSEEIAIVLNRVDSPLVGSIFDTTNALGFVERPGETLSRLGPRLVSTHIKDYRICKAEASYVITGEVLGRGQLDSAAIIKAINKYNPSAKLIMEMTVRRREGARVEEAVSEEREQITASLCRLRDLLGTPKNLVF